MIQEDPPCVQADTETVNARLLESILVEKSEELKNGEKGVKFNSFQVGGDKPVEKIATLSKKPKSNHIF